MNTVSFKSLSIGLTAAMLLTACGTVPALEALTAGNPSQASGTGPESATGDSGGAEAAQPPAQASPGRLAYPLVDSGQGACFDAQGVVDCPAPGEAFYGQDAQYAGARPAYQDNGDGTVTDLRTGLTWMQDPGEKVTYAEGLALAGDFSTAGHDDWRVPTIKELYSLMDFSGVDDAGAGTDPFIDAGTFVFEYGDTTAGERAIDSQWITSTRYTASVMGGQGCFFGVNFADGRIKCYPTGDERVQKTYFLRLVRGGEGYGANQFVAGGDGTVSDLATGLVWQGSDSGAGMDWAAALDYCEGLELAGRDDWRLPDAKELQSIVDYGRGPDASDSAAIDALFWVSEIVNEAGEKDYPYFWTSTTHADARGGQAAAYVAFGRALGYMNGAWVDVHGAGAQRSDPKTGSASSYPTGRGPQGDAIRVENHARCVRGGGALLDPDGDLSAAPALPVFDPAGDERAGAPAGPTQGGAAAGPRDGTPPQAALQACAGASQGAACSFAGPRGMLSGACTAVETGALACVPPGGPPAGAPPSP